MCSDGFGGVHRGGGAPPITPPKAYLGWNIARDLELHSRPRSAAPRANIEHDFVESASQSEVGSGLRTRAPRVTSLLRLSMLVVAPAQLACGAATPAPVAHLIEQFGPASVVSSPLTPETREPVVMVVRPTGIPGPGLDAPVSAVPVDPFPALDHDTFQPRRLRITTPAGEIPERTGTDDPPSTWFFDGGTTLVRLAHEDLVVNPQQPFTGWIYSSEPARSKEPISLPAGVYDVTVVASGMRAFDAAPRVRVRVDGVAIGRAAVDADHLSVETETLRFPVALAEGEHRLAVDLLNDAFDPASGSDTNLFIHEVAISSRSGVYLRGPEVTEPLEVLYEPAAAGESLVVAAARHQAPDYPGDVFIKKVRIGNQSRNALLAPAPTDFRFEVDVPEGGRLSFGIATLPESWHENGDGVYFSVEVRGGGDAEVLFERYLDPKRRPEERDWIDANVDLGRYAGGRIELWLRTAGTYPIAPPAERPGDETADLALWSAPLITPGASNDPIVILLSIDTLRADHVGAYGYERPTTPLLDRLAGEGTRFERCYSQAPYTLPSHMSLLTGLFPFQHAVEDPARALLDPELVTFPELFRDRGFSTAAFTEGGLVTAEYGFSHGFDVYRESAMFQHIHEGLVAPVGKGGRATLQAGLDWLSDTARGSPAFLFLHTYQVHDPFNPPPEVRRLFPAEPGDDYPELVSLYDSEIRHFDDMLGWFLDQLRERGLLQRVTLAVVSDHGIELGERGNWLGHELRLYEENLRVPCILWGPTIPPRRIHEEVRLIDIVPTVMQAVGMDLPEEIAGVGIPLDGSDPAPGIYPNIAESGIVPERPVRSYRVPRYTLIVRESLEGDVITRELYDRKYDPAESENLARSEPALVALLEGELREILATGPRARVLFERRDLEALRALGYIR